MTSYSVLRSAQRAIVIATWPGAWSDHSANITTLADSEQAAYLASALTRISEDAWDAAAFLDASPALELGISALIEQLRGPADKIEPVSIPGDGYRHAGQWSFTDAAEVLASDAPAALSTLTRPQRLTVADELAADAAERASAAQVLASGNDPASGIRGRGRCARSPGPCATARSGRSRKGLPAGWSARGGRTSARPSGGPPATGWCASSSSSRRAKRTAGGPGRRTIPSWLTWSSPAQARTKTTRSST